MADTNDLPRLSPLAVGLMKVPAPSTLLMAVGLDQLGWTQAWPSQAERADVSSLPALEVSDASLSVHSTVLPSCFVVPFYSEPRSTRGRDRARVAHRAQVLYWAKLIIAAGPAK